MDARLIHDTAIDMARAILRAVQDCLFEHEHQIAFDEFYAIAKQELERYTFEVERMQKRLRPSGDVCSDGGQHSVKE